MKFIDAVKEAVDFYQAGRDGTRLPGVKLSFTGYQVWELVYPFEQIWKGDLGSLVENMRGFFIDPDSEIPTALELAAFGLLTAEGFGMVGVFKKTEQGWQHTYHDVTVFERDLGTLLVYLGYPNVF